MSDNSTTTTNNKLQQNGIDKKPANATGTTEIATDIKQQLSSDLNNLNIECMSIDDIFKLAREFIKAKEGTKAVHLSYDDRNMMNVLTKMINNFKLEDEKQKVGFLDLVGKDRLQIWKTLGDLPREHAMKNYIQLIVKVCPLFIAHLEAHLKNLEEERLKILEEEKRRKEMTEQKEKKLREEDLRLLEENKKKREEIQRKQIQEALNQQTYPHFKAYAEQQHPNNVQAQEELIKQLQEQHFEQYMNQVYQQQLLHQQQQAEQLRAMRRAQKKQDQTEDQFKKLTLNDTNVHTETNAIINTSPVYANLQQQQQAAQQTVLSHDSINISLVSERDSSSVSNNHSFEASQQPQLQLQANQSSSVFNNSNSSNINSSNLNAANNAHLSDVATRDNDQNNGQDDENEEIELPPISAASMITRKDIKEFKESVRKDNDAIIKVGSGETVTVRVPTHEDGRLIFWEFATDYYDLGFGLYFEWTISPSNNVTVHVSDSSEDEEGEDGNDENNKQDVEKGDKSNENKPPVDEIIPIFRRDCHEEVYAGSHLYPGRGVYLLKFDNSYSLWRSKTLYYRVYYSK